jgi:hypothetical protein
VAVPAVVVAVASAVVAVVVSPAVVAVVLPVVAVVASLAAAVVVSVAVVAAAASLVAVAVPGVVASVVAGRESVILCTVFLRRLGESGAFSGNISLCILRNLLLHWLQAVEYHHQSKKYFGYFQSCSRG